MCISLKSVSIILLVNNSTGEWIFKKDTDVISVYQIYSILNTIEIKTKLFIILGISVDRYLVVLSCGKQSLSCSDYSNWD